MKIKSCSLGMETEKVGLALGGGLETTEPSFLGMSICLTGSGASPKGREGGMATRGLSPALGPHFAGGAFPGLSIGLGKRLEAWFRRGVGKETSKGDSPSVLC